MQRFLVRTVWIVLATVLATLPLAASSTMLAPGDSVSDIRGFDAAGDLYVVDFSKAKFTLINFWADWCEPCKAEMPLLQRAHEKYGSQGLQIIGVTSDALDAETFVEFVESVGVTYPMFVLSGEAKKRWPGVRGTLPNSFLIDANKKLVRRYVGASPEQMAALEHDLAAIVAGRPLGKMVLSNGTDAVKGGTDKTPR